MVDLDITKYDIVPRLRNREWNGAPHCLWANIFDQDIPNAPIVAFGLDNPSTVIFPERKVFTAAGYNTETILEKAIQFLHKQKPVWENFNPEISEEEKIDFPKTLVHYHEYGAEQILNRDFLAKACEILKSQFVFVAAMNQMSILAMGYTQDSESIFQFIALQLFRFGQSPTTRITPGVFMADQNGRLVGGVGYSQALYDSIMKTVEEDDDTKVKVNLIQRASERILEIVAYGSNPEMLFSEIWSKMITESNKLKLKADNKKENLLNVELVLLTDKMPPIELFEDEIRQLKQRISGSNEDIQGFGANGMFSLKIIYKKSTSLLI